MQRDRRIGGREPRVASDLEDLPVVERLDSPGHGQVDDLSPARSPRIRDALPGPLKELVDEVESHQLETPQPILMLAQEPEQLDQLGARPDAHIEHPRGIEVADRLEDRTDRELIGVSQERGCGELGDVRQPVLLAGDPDLLAAQIGGELRRQRIVGIERQQRGDGLAGCLHVTRLTLHRERIELNEWLGAIRGAQPGDRFELMLPAEPSRKQHRQLFEPLVGWLRLEPDLPAKLGVNRIGRARAEGRIGNDALEPRAIDVESCGAFHGHHATTTGERSSAPQRRDRPRGRERRVARGAERVRCSEA